MKLLAILSNLALLINLATCAQTPLKCDISTGYPISSSQTSGGSALPASGSGPQPPKPATPGSDSSSSSAISQAGSALLCSAIGDPSSCPGSAYPSSAASDPVIRRTRRAEKQAELVCKTSEVCFVYEEKVPMCVDGESGEYRLASGEHGSLLTYVAGASESGAAGMSGKPSGSATTGAVPGRETGGASSGGVGAKDGTEDHAPPGAAALSGGSGPVSVEGLLRTIACLVVLTIVVC